MAGFCYPVSGAPRADRCTTHSPGRIGPRSPGAGRATRRSISRPTRRVRHSRNADVAPTHPFGIRVSARHRAHRLPVAPHRFGGVDGSCQPTRARSDTKPTPDLHSTPDGRRQYAGGNADRTRTRQSAVEFPATGGQPCRRAVKQDAGNCASRNSAGRSAGCVGNVSRGNTDRCLRHRRRS